MSTQRILFAILLIAAVTTVVVGLCMVENAYAAGPEPQQQPPDCTTCHADRAKQWETSRHAQAFSSAEFKKTWDAGKNQPDCLACHTTGFDVNTGKYKQEGVGCSTCHKPGPNGHPGGPMSVADSAEFCGTCHTSTYHEWQKSGHGQANLACSSCHDMHSTELRFKTTADLCSSCHKERANQAGMPMDNTAGACTNCHMYNITKGANAEGKAPTGHSFVMGTDACQRCHKDNIHVAHKVISTAPPQPGTDKPIQQPVASRVAAAAPAASNMSSALPGAAGGLIGGLLLGFISAVVVIRRKE